MDENAILEKRALTAVQIARVIFLLAIKLHFIHAITCIYCAGNVSYTYTLTNVRVMTLSSLISAKCDRVTGLDKRLRHNPSS